MLEDSSCTTPYLKPQLWHDDKLQINSTSTEGFLILLTISKQGEQSHSGWLQISQQPLKLQRGTNNLSQLIVSFLNSCEKYSRIPLTVKFWSPIASQVRYKFGDARHWSTEMFCLSRSSTVE